MRVRVQLRDGKMETITLVPPITIHDSPYDVPNGVGMLAHLHCGDGTDHYFTYDSGHYDGWGRAAAEASTLNDAAEVIGQVEDERQIEPPPVAPREGSDG